MTKVTMTDVVDGIAVGSTSISVEVTQGTVGPQGPKGDPGDPGDPGTDGESAYQLAVDAGFSGTVSAWLASLVGAQGDPGTDGTDGAPGQGVPVGGTTGQVLAKASTTDYDTAWTDAASGSGAVDSVNGQTGTVVLTAADVSADASGAASAAQTAAEGYTDTAIASEVTRANGAYDAAGAAATAQTNAESYADTGDALKLAKASNLSDVASASTARTNLGVAYGTAAGTVAQGNDSRLSDARTPTAHASTHGSAGSDPVTIAESQVTGLTTDLAGKVPTTRTVAGHALSADVTLVKGDVGLGNVDNTADTAKPVSTAQQTALDLKANLASPALTGNPTAPTQTAGNNSTRLATTAYADNAVAKQPEVLVFALGDETTALTTGTKVTFRMPFAMTLTSVRASLTTASSSGNPAFDVKESGTTIFSTALTIDATEKTSQTAATPAVISDASLADDAEITLIVSTAGTGAAGAKITFIGMRT